MEDKIGLLIGRFQPFHLGHLYLLKKSFEFIDKLVIGIGSASIYDKNNPLSSWQRRLILKKVIEKESLSEKIIKIVELEDFFNDENWLENVKKQVDRFNLVIGNNEWTNKIMEKAGYQVKRLPYYKRYLYEGWRIRKLVKNNKSWQDRVPDYLVSQLKIFFKKKKYSFEKIALGGTFDHFHLGHKKLLEISFSLSKKVIIGISKSQLLLKNKVLFEAIESYSQRKKSVCNFLSKKKWLDRALIIPINDFIGKVDKLKKVQGLVLSRQTYLNGLKINQLREDNGLEKLRLIIVNDVLTDDGQLVSSERIRIGEIDRKGRVYFNLFKKTLVIPESIKLELKKPMGKVYQNISQFLKERFKSVMTVAVGDIIVGEFLKNNLAPDLKIIDFKSKRLPISQDLTSLFKRNYLTNELADKWENQPGTVNSTTVCQIKKLINLFLKEKKPQSLMIDGEEDLLGLPAILLAPLRSIVLYGHFQYGLIAVFVDEKIKNKLYNMIKLVQLIS